MQPPPSVQAPTAPLFFYLNTVDVLNLMILFSVAYGMHLGMMNRISGFHPGGTGRAPLQSDNLQYLHCQVPPGGQDRPQLRTTATVPTLNPGPGKRQFLKTEKTDPDLVLILGELFLSFCIYKLGMANSRTIPGEA